MTPNMCAVTASQTYDEKGKQIMVMDHFIMNNRIDSAV